MFSVWWTCRCPGCNQVFQRKSACCSLLARKAPNVVMLQSSVSQNCEPNLQLISQYPVLGMTVTVLASRIRSHPGFLKSDFLRQFSYKELPTEVLPSGLLDFNVKFSLISVFHITCLYGNQTIILLLLVLVISNLNPGNSLLFPGSVYLNMILIQVSTSNCFWFPFKQQGLFQMHKTQRIFSIVFLAFFIFFPS